MCHYEHASPPTINDHHILVISNSSINMNIHCNNPQVSKTRGGTLMSTKDAYKHSGSILLLWVLSMAGILLLNSMGINMFPN